MNGSNPQNPSLSQTPQRPSGKGGNCFFKGCLIVAIVLMLAGVVIGGLGWYLFRHAQPFFSHEPVAIRAFEGGEPAYAAVQTKFAQFNQTLATGQPTTLTLTADDLNALVAHQPDLANLHDRIYLTIVNNQIVAETSFPLNEDGTNRSDQRVFFNARVVVDASYSSGDFTFLLARFETLSDHHQPPSALMGFVRTYLAALNQGFNRSFHDHPENNPDLKQITDQIRTVVIKDNQIVATSVEHPKPLATPGASPVAGTPEPR